THIHGIFPFFYIQVNLAQIEEIGQEHGREGFLRTFADGLEHAMCLHQTSLVAQRANFAAWGTRERSYLYDLRWVTGWQSVYGYSSGHGRGEDADEFFIQIWASQPQYVGLMAHLLQQGAVLSTSFQPFEVHLPYLLHFLDSFGLGGMRELVVDPTRIALRGELPEQALSTFPWHPLWVSKLGSGARERLLRRRLERPWWCDRAASKRRPKSVHPRATTCEVEVDCSATDILPPLSSTASEMPSCEAQEASVRDLTRGWICETLRELWRDEERRCTVLAQPVPWDPAPRQPGVPGPGTAGQRHAAARTIGESVSPGRGSEAACFGSVMLNLWQADTKCKVSPKFVRALETLEALTSNSWKISKAAFVSDKVALSQQVQATQDCFCPVPGFRSRSVGDLVRVLVVFVPRDPPADEATTALLDQGDKVAPCYQHSDPQDGRNICSRQACLQSLTRLPADADDDTATEPETDCGTTELDEDQEAEALDAELAAAESTECAPTQLDSATQATPPTPAPPKPLCQASDTAPLFGTLLTIEVLELPRGGTAQPFQSDAIGAVAFCIRDERVRSLLLEDGEDYQDGLGLICIEGSETLKIDSAVVVKEVASEVDIFGALTDVFRETDPAVVMGYDVVKGSLGRLISRAQTLGLRGFSQDLARAAANSRSGGQQEAAAMSSQVADTHGSPEQTGAPRKLYPPEQMSGGLELPGRLVLNVWRVLRAEAKLPTSSLHTAAEVLLGETLPLLPSEALVASPDEIATAPKRKRWLCWQTTGHYSQSKPRWVWDGVL
ncbi:REV3, partial [Symbiodinium necroappetens]